MLWSSLLQGAGYISAGRVGTAGAGSKAGGPGTAQEQARQMEERVHTLLEQCADLRLQVGARYPMTVLSLAVLP